MCIFWDVSNLYNAHMLQGCLDDTCCYGDECWVGKMFLYKHINNQNTRR